MEYFEAKSAIDVRLSCLTSFVIFEFENKGFYLSSAFFYSLSGVIVWEPHTLLTLLRGNPKWRIWYLCFRYLWLSKVLPLSSEELCFYWSPFWFVKLRWEQTQTCSFWWFRSENPNSISDDLCCFFWEQSSFCLWSTLKTECSQLLN